MRQGSPTPWAYWAIRLLFRGAVRGFYGNIVLENVENIPPRGVPCILCPNHSNSLMDTLLVCSQIPAERREFVRLVAKSTLWGRGDFGSWLVENTNSVPIMRRQDLRDGEKLDNTATMAKIMEALELGDIVLLYPEGVSKYQPYMSPLKTGVARIVSDALSRNRDDPDFEVAIATCSVTYIHREHFRSDVLVAFHPPLLYSPKENPELLAPVDDARIRQVSEDIRRNISSGLFDAPSWDTLRAAKVAVNVYAPLGTRMSLGSYVRLTKRFVDALKRASEQTKQETLPSLESDIKAYGDQLSALKITDERIRKRTRRPLALLQLIIRFAWGTVLGTLALPGLLLWLPAFIYARCKVRRSLRRGPPSDTWDTIAETKISSGLVAAVPTWLIASLGGLRYSRYSPLLVSATMWMSLRWMEDSVASMRTAVVLWRYLIAPDAQIQTLRKRRRDLHSRLMDLAVHELGLPANPVESLADGMSSLESVVRYFSPLRRRKRDWNEILRLHEKVNYPLDDDTHLLTRQCPIAHP